MISGKNMEHIDTSTKIKCLIEMAIKSEMSWLALDPVIDKLTPTLEKSRQIVKILLKEFETHQSICTLNIPNDGNYLLSEDINLINEDQSITDEEKMIHSSNSEEFGIEFTEEKLLSEDLIKNRSEEMNGSVSEEHYCTNEVKDESDADFSEADSEGVEVFDENDVSKSIQLVEAFKGQLYTFVGDDSEEKCATNSYDESLDNHKESSGNKDHIKVYSRETNYKARRTSHECEIRLD